MGKEKDKLTAAQIATRVISVIVCSIGASACIFSLSLQIEEIGTMISSVVWFSGLAGVVASLGGYASSCNPRQNTSHIIPAVIAGAILTSLCFGYELENLRAYDVSSIALLALLVEAAWLVVFRFILKRNDPDAC